TQLATRLDVVEFSRAFPRGHRRQLTGQRKPVTGQNFRLDADASPPFPTPRRALFTSSSMSMFGVADDSRQRLCDDPTSGLVFAWTAARVYGHLSSPAQSPLLLTDRPFPHQWPPVLVLRPTFACPSTFIDKNRRLLWWNSSSVPSTIR
ncbi:hypothetical protein BN1723_004585, partial [Verticillium longisporum]